MATTRQYATRYVQMHAAAAVTPALDADEIAFCIDQSQLTDAAGRSPGAVGYVETIWATRAVYLALELKLEKASAMVDFTADGGSIAQSQLTANITARRNSWAAGMLPGSV